VRLRRPRRGTDGRRGQPRFACHDALIAAPVIGPGRYGYR
jgi:hypothetical protein